MGFRPSWEIHLGADIQLEGGSKWTWPTPISWIIQASYIAPKGDGGSPYGSGPLMLWFKGTNYGGSDTIFYAALSRSDPGTFEGQSVVSRLGSTYKVYGTEIVSFVKMADDSANADLLLTAYPQDNSQAVVEATETTAKLIDNQEKRIPFWATHIIAISDLDATGTSLVVLDKTGGTVFSLSALVPGQVIPLPYDSFSIKSDGGDAWISYKYFGVR